MQGELEKCKEALNSWLVWKESLEIARAKIQKKYGDVDKLIAGAKIEYEVLSKGLPEENIEFSVNSAQQKKWKIETRLEDIAKDFVIREIGLCADTYIHNVFVGIWVSSISPLFNIDVIEERELQEEMESEYRDSRKIYLQTKEKSTTDKRLWSSVSWYHETVSHHEVAEFLKKLVEWPITKEMARKRSGGRGQKKDTIEIEAVVCALLKDKQGLKYKEINQIFKWKEPGICWSAQEERDTKRLISQTAISRVKLGRSVLKQYST
ncbi:hypothetical protein ACFLXJ_03150 [Chloroflexota bacterium]